MKKNYYYKSIMYVFVEESAPHLLSTPTFTQQACGVHLLGPEVLWV